MKEDAVDALNVKGPKKIPSKETLNHYALLFNTSGIDPYTDIEASYTATISKLGIDFIIGVPVRSEIERIEKGETRTRKVGRKTVGISYLGVYPTRATIDYGFKTVEEVFAYNPEIEDPIDMKKLMDDYSGKYLRSCSLAGDAALIYPWYYYTLFMGPLETFGWEMFMLAAMEDADAFDVLLEHFKNQSVKHFSAMDQLNTDFIMIHDDICMGTGPVFKPDWYDKHIFPRYKELFAPIKKKGKKIIFTSDGNIDVFIDSLIDCGIDGFMIETPATDFDNIIEKCGHDKVIIGGIDTRALTCDSAEHVFEHTKEVLRKGRNCPGFFISSPGGLHGNIPYENLLAYFEAREKYGYR